MKKLRILHIMISSSYTENMTYQENQITKQNVLDGHEVLCISDSKKFVDGELVETGYEDVVIDNGIRLIRLPYIKIINEYISNKIRDVGNLYNIIDSFTPDVILSHGLFYLSVLDVIHYKKNHPECKFYADTHVAHYNSGRNWISLRLLHGIYYRYLIHKALPYLDKYLYIGENERVFSETVYGVPEDVMEYFPLGGFIFTDEEYKCHRKRRRDELQVDLDTVLYVHSGKLGKEKRTIELIEAFSTVNDVKSKLVIIGTIPDEQMKILMPRIRADKRVVFLGWKTGEELREYLCAGDVYCQPGSVSATLQNAICQSCAIMTYPHLQYVKRLDYGNIFFVKNKQEMIDVFQTISNNPEMIERYKKASKKCALEILDYKVIAKRLYT